MKTVRFLKEHDDGQRVYLRGQAHEFEDAVANQLVKDGVAQAPEKEMPQAEKSEKKKTKK